MTQLVFDDVFYNELKEKLSALVDVIIYSEQFSQICFADHISITTKDNTNVYYLLYLNLSIGRFLIELIDFTFVDV